MAESTLPGGLLQFRSRSDIASDLGNMCYLTGSGLRPRNQLPAAALLATTSTAGARESVHVPPDYQRRAAAAAVQELGRAEFVLRFQKDGTRTSDLRGFPR